MSKFKRKQLWVDPKIQGALIVRVLAYWISCLITVALLGRVTVGMASIFPGLEDQTWLPYMPALLASAFFLPLVVQDTLRLSNRFVGPMFRLRRSLRDLADGKKVRKIYFREGDMWQEFADDFNDLVVHFQMEKTANDDTADESNVSDFRPAAEQGTDSIVVPPPPAVDSDTPQEVASV